MGLGEAVGDPEPPRLVTTTQPLLRIRSGPCSRASPLCPRLVGGTPAWSILLVGIRQAALGLTNLLLRFATGCVPPRAPPSKAPFVWSWQPLGSNGRETSDSRRPSSTKHPPVDLSVHPHPAAPARAKTRLHYHFAFIMITGKDVEWS